MPGADPDASREGNSDPDATANLPRRQTGVEKEPREPAVSQLFKQLLIKLGGGQLITSAEAATAGDSKTPPEAGCGVEPSWQDTGPAEAQDASMNEPSGSAPQRMGKGSSQKVPGTLQTAVPEHERLAAGVSP